MQDTYRHKGLRKQLIESLRQKDITDEAVLSAMQKIPRHVFLDSSFLEFAYQDKPFPIGSGQTISQPYTVAFMTEVLNLSEGDKILEIGTGSGYQAAILSYLEMKVFSVERNFELYNRTQLLFDQLGIRAVLRCADGTLGWNEFAPYNAIIVTAGSPDLPKSLFRQLAIDGKLIIPIGPKKKQELKLFTKLSDEKYSVKTFPDFSFVPLIGREGWKE